MSDYPIDSVREAPGEWGGSWTEKKLDAFEKYVDAYLRIMEHYPYWETIYFDGFAGSGSRQQGTSALYDQLQLTFEEKEGYKGSAERVIRLKRSFDYYYFIDQPKSLEKLKETLGKLPESEGKDMVFRDQDYNLELSKLAGALKNNGYAALVLLDPFGMDVEWRSIAQLAGTRSDVWILIPTGVIVNRLLDHEGKLRHALRLQSFFGLTEKEIRSEFYRPLKRLTLFGEETVVEKITGSIQHIAALYIRQLQKIWKCVTEEPLVLYNSRNCPMYHFVFASNNSTAVKIAGEIIEKV